jgi:hypothetical protein
VFVLCTSSPRKTTIDLLNILLGMLFYSAVTTAYGSDWRPQGFMHRHAKHARQSPAAMPHHGESVHAPCTHHESSVHACMHAIHDLARPLGATGAYQK